ncbi:hypothetical protein [Vibrio sp. PNB22_8_1]|uniref:hypothetical protein n=1 Tax=unclassified Vibrio TaxID=2614977 RepID=UPI00406A1595
MPIDYGERMKVYLDDERIAPDACAGSNRTLIPVLSGRTFQLTLLNLAVFFADWDRIGAMLASSFLPLSVLSPNLPTTE